MLALERESLLCQTPQDQRARFGVNILSFCRVLAVERNFDLRGAAAEADLEPAVAELVEHTNLFEEAKRVIERQRVHHGAKTNFLGALRDRSHKNAGRGRHADRRRVMLGKMIGVETGALVGFDDLQARFVELVEW